jgi:hypothetical protein
MTRELSQGAGPSVYDGFYGELIRKMHIQPLRQSHLRVSSELHDDQSNCRTIAEKKRLLRCIRVLEESRCKAPFARAGLKLSEV